MMVDALLTLSVIARSWSSLSLGAVSFVVADVDGMLMSSSGVESGIACSAHTVISSTHRSQKIVFGM
jgi:hypothetical protein